MKKLYIPMMLMAVAAIASCEKQPVAIDEPETGSYVYTMKASVPEAIDVKSDYDASGNFSWSAGDAISVLFHKGDDNKFFTLTTTGTGADASFSGTIDDGYVIGASDGDDLDKKIWALFPASANHSYTAGAYPTFYTPGEVDFTAPGAHYSANLPMYACLTAAGDIAFANMSSAYKFIITDLDDSINKVKFVVSNQQTHGLSGSFPLFLDGSILLNYGWTGAGTPGRSLTFTANKVGTSAVFYVPCRWYGNFQPEINIYNAENNYTLKHLVASTNKIPNSMTTVKPITISAPGTGSAPASINVDWSLVTPAIDGINDRIVEWKTTSDSENIYFYYKFTKSKFKKNGSSKFYIGFDTDNNAATGSDSSNGAATTGGIEAMAYFYPWTGGDADGAPDGIVSGEDPSSFVQAPVGTTAAGVKVLVQGTMDGTYVYLEVAIPRAGVGISVGDNVTVITAVQNYPTTAEAVSY